MGLGGISIWQLLIILAIVVMLFGTKRLRGMGSDLGAAIKGFRNSMSDADDRPANLENRGDDSPTGGKAETRDADPTHNKS